MIKIQDIKSKKNEFKLMNTLKKYESIEFFKKIIENILVINGNSMYCNRIY